MTGAPCAATRRAASQLAAHLFDHEAGGLRASGNLFKSWNRRAEEALLKPCLPVRHQGAELQYQPAGFYHEHTKQSPLLR